MKNNRLKVLCVGDSLGMPRDGVDYSNTWIYKLKSATDACDFIPLFRRAQTTNCLTEEKEYLLWYSADIVIIQLGIVDCAPRYILDTSLLYKLAVRLPDKLQSLFWKVYKKTHKRTLKRVYVRPEQFRSNIENYIELCRANGISRVIFIKIATPAQAMIDSNPLMKIARWNYNEILDQIESKFSPFCTVIDPLHQGDARNYVQDGYHPNDCGNELVANSILNELNGEI